MTVLLEEHTSFFRHHPRSEDHYSIGAVILVHVCQMVCNAHAITELCPVDANGERQERVATAIYPSASLMNHSCDPSVINRLCVLNSRCPRLFNDSSPVSRATGSSFAPSATFERAAKFSIVTDPTTGE